MVSSLIKVLVTSSLAGNTFNRRDFIVVTTPSILLSSSDSSSSSSSTLAGLPTKQEHESIDVHQVFQEHHQKHKKEEIPLNNNIENSSNDWKISLPLERFFGGTNCIRVGIYGKPQQLGSKIITPKRIYKLIVDTGSPYLTIPIPIEGEDNGYYYNTVYEDADPMTDESKNYANQSTIGLKSLFKVLQGSLLTYSNFERDEQVPFMLESSKYSSTEDVYGTKLGVIEWRQSSITFRNNRFTTTDTNTDKRSAIFGVLDETLTSESGGPLLGLIKKSNPNSDKVQLRPSILDQIRIQSSRDDNAEEREVTSFQIDSPNKILTVLAQEDESLIPKDANNIIELVDLRTLGDFVDHYAFKIDSLSLNSGEFVFTPKSLTGSKVKQPKSIVAVFDTGLTGCLFTQPLWEVLIEYGIKDTSTIKGVEVLSSKNNVSISSDDSSQFFYVSAINLDWFDDPKTAPFVVVLGQTFLAQGTLTVDINRNLATFNTP